jgi:hypothetical protein
MPEATGREPCSTAKLHINYHAANFAQKLAADIGEVVSLTVEITVQQNHLCEARGVKLQRVKFAQLGKNIQVRKQRSCAVLIFGIAGTLGGPGGKLGELKHDMQDGRGVSRLAIL